MAHRKLTLTRKTKHPTIQIHEGKRTSGQGDLNGSNGFEDKKIHP